MDNQDIIQRCDEILEAYKPKPKPKFKKEAPLIELNKKYDSAFSKIFYIVKGHADLAIFLFMIWPYFITAFILMMIWIF